MLEVGSRIAIPYTEFDFSFARSGGPGGQNVNKVNSKVTLKWDVQNSPTLPDDVRRRFVERWKRRLSTEGVLVIQSQRFRDQGRNVADSLDKLRELLTEVATPPRKRKPTGPTKGSVERRLKEKKAASEKKGGRRQSFGNDA